MNPITIDRVNDRLKGFTGIPMLDAVVAFVVACWARNADLGLGYAPRNYLVNNFTPGHEAGIALAVREGYFERRSDDTITLTETLREDMNRFLRQKDALADPNFHAAVRAHWPERRGTDMVSRRELANFWKLGAGYDRDADFCAIMGDCFPTMGLRGSSMRVLTIEDLAEFWWYATHPLPRVVTEEHVCA